MNLKIKAGEPGERTFKPGYTAQAWLDGVDISDYTTRIELDVDAGKPLSATITLYLTALEVEVPAIIDVLQAARVEKDGMLVRFAMGSNLIRYDPIVKEDAA